MAVDLSDIDFPNIIESPSSLDDDNDDDDGSDDVVAVPVTEPVDPHWKRNRRRARRASSNASTGDSGTHDVVVVPSDSEDNDSDDDDVAIVSVCPAPSVDNDSDDCIVESYQPPSKSFCAVSPDSVLTVPSSSNDAPSVDVACTNTDLDLQIAAYNQSVDQPGSFLVHDLPDLGAWIFPSDSASSVKQPEVDPAADACSDVSQVLACSSAFGMPLALSVASTENANPQQSSFSGDLQPMQFNAVQLQSSSILLDVSAAAAQVSANIDKTSSVLSLSAQIQSSDDRQSTTVSFVGSISDGKSPSKSDFVSVQTDLKRPPDDLNLSLVTVSPVASPVIVPLSDKVSSYCSTASVSVNVDSSVDAALNDTVDGLLNQMSSQSERKLVKLDAIDELIKVENEERDVNPLYSSTGRCLSSVAASSSGACSHLPGRVGKRKSEVGTSARSSKTPRLPFDSHTTSTLNGVSSTNAIGEQKVPCPTLDACQFCYAVLAVEQLSRCLFDHPCCGTCLQKHVKTVLTSGVKVDIMCLRPDCAAIYPPSELRKSLPEMVVDILQEKQKNSQKPLLLSEADDAINSCIAALASGCQPSTSTSDSTANSRTDDGLYEFPKNWEPMDDSEHYRKVLLEPGSDEYAWVSSAFHQTMSWPRAYILRIHRVQNQTLWQFYVVKRHQMQRDLGASAEPVNEKFLFHGTSRNAVDAICANNFDWRVCGSHGTVYGQGSYFATEAAYSHMYTDSAGRNRGGSHSSLYGLSSRAASLSYYRRQLSSLAATLGSMVNGLPSSLYPVGSAPPAHQSKAIVVHPQPVQPAHQATLPPLSGPVSHVVGGPGLPPDVSAFMQAPVFRIPSATTTYPITGPSLQPVHLSPPVATGSGWFPPQQSGSTSRHSSALGSSNGVARSTTPPLAVVDPNAVLPNHKPPTSFSAAHKSLLVPAPVAHRAMPPSSLPASAGSSASQPTSGVVPPAHGVVPSSHSAHYPTSSTPTHHTMFFARVLVGRSAVGSSEYRTPPPLDPADRYGRCFDSCVNRPINPSIYVIFNSAQSYPEYIIEYVNKSKSADPV